MTVPAKFLLAGIWLFGLLLAMAVQPPEGSGKAFTALALAMLSWLAAVYALLRRRALSLDGAFLFAVAGLSFSPTVIMAAAAFTAISFTYFISHLEIRRTRPGNQFMRHAAGRVAAVIFASVGATLLAFQLPIYVGSLASKRLAVSLDLQSFEILVVASGLCLAVGTGFTLGRLRWRPASRRTIDVGDAHRE